MRHWQRICAARDIHEDRPLGLEISGKRIGIFVENGRCHALDNICSHAFALLSTGWVEDGAVECPLHGARFDLETGACVSTPPYTSINAFQVRVEGDDVMLLVDENGSAVPKAAGIVTASTDGEEAGTQF